MGENIHKYTLYGSVQIEKEIADHMELVNKKIYNKIDEKDIEAVILGGGYGGNIINYE